MSPWTPSHPQTVERDRIAKRTLSRFYILQQPRNIIAESFPVSERSVALQRAVRRFETHLEGFKDIKRIYL